jgi:hypothetical protein
MVVIRYRNQYVNKDHRSKEHKSFQGRYSSGIEDLYWWDYTLNDIEKT